MIFTTNTLSEKLSNYKDVNGKIMRMIKEGEIFSVTRGVYETDRNIPGYCLSSVIYGPSYLSFDYVLSKYGLIPEAVYSYTSATFEKKKKKEYNNVFGRYTYCDVPASVYPYDVKIMEENGYFYRIATAEKAFCDKLYTLPPVYGIKELKELLFYDLRIDKNEFDKLDKIGLCELCDKYHSSNTDFLKKYAGGKI